MNIARIITHFALVAALPTLLAACSSDRAVAPAATALSSGVRTQNFDTKQRLQDDLYRHVNGQWLAATEIPADKSNYGVFSALSDKAEQDLRAIVEQAAGQQDATGDQQKIGAFYASFLDEAKIEELGIKPLESELKRIDAIRTPRDLAVAIGRLQRIGVGQPFAYFVGIDEKNSSTYISYVYQNGLGMPDRDYYLSEDAKMQAIRDKYRAYLGDLLVAAGSSERDAKAAAERIAKLETQLAKAQWTRVENRDANKTYNKHTIAEAQKLTPAFDWRAFLEGAASPKVDAVVISQPSFFKAFDLAVQQVPLAQWREYLRYKVIDSYAMYLPSRIVNIDFEFGGRVLSGTAELRPRWKRGVQAVENSVGDMLGRVYVERHFSEDAKQRVQALVTNLQKAYAAGIDQLEWMSAATKQQAHAKLAKFTPKIGYPDKWKDWSALEVRRDDLIGNVMRAAQIEYDREVAKIGGPVDRTEWHMNPQTVNAYYNPPANEIVFPAAILQPPFFDVNADDAVNYGGIGAVIGHEISHGFDDQGRHYDGDGNLKSWWTDADDREFRKRADALVKQFSAYTPLPEAHINGELTLGENIADLAGVAMAYRAYKLSLADNPAQVLDGYTGEQRFFIGYAQVWARKYRDDELRKRLLTDSHSPSEYRVNGIVVNQPAFAEAFALKEGDKLFVPPERRVKIW
ncbi:MAG: M13 family metallopeptidase [Candidatus Obscuribacterales bacterium]|nr:M13 family metallopeptidase [Steroidobacteraceae bacterium]